MRRYGPAVILLLCGAAILRIALFSNLYLRYVQPALHPYLITSGALLSFLGLLRAAQVTLDRRRRNEPGDGHSHDEEQGRAHAHGSRAAWLLAVPALLLLLSPPPALGSYSADREEAQRTAQGVGTFPALPHGNPVDLTLGAFTSRAIYDSGRSLKGRTIRMTGFVTRGKGDTWYLTRLFVTCCAADATAYKTEIRGAQAPAPDTWVSVTGVWHPKGSLGSAQAWPPVLDADSVKRVKEPQDPYEKR
ncbi:TIGR03943 family putative permease subunit [Streptomyces sp. NPDC001978]|uniref:TIGR03943 family putative permease subunit n=1 Tax=Streptomyces sp. NPDC001978 TaxID=3364627 RepID=UPI0036C3FCFA